MSENTIGLTWNTYIDLINGLKENLSLKVQNVENTS